MSARPLPSLTYLPSRNICDPWHRSVPGLIEACSCIQNRLTNSTRSSRRTPDSSYAAPSASPRDLLSHDLFSNQNPGKARRLSPTPLFPKA